jgi:hypothetical protein
VSRGTRRTHSEAYGSTRRWIIAARRKERGVGGEGRNDDLYLEEERENTTMAIVLLHRSLRDARSFDLFRNFLRALEADALRRSSLSLPSGLSRLPPVLEAQSGCV